MKKMKAIKFSENELEFIRNHYEGELEEAQKYIEHVKEILAKIGGIQKDSQNYTSDKEIKVGKKRGRKPGKKVSIVPSEPKKRGRKPKAKTNATAADAGNVQIGTTKKRGRKPVKKVELSKAEPKKLGRKPKSAGPPEKLVQTGKIIEEKVKDNPKNDRSQ
jgi:hypothetical protein